MVQVENKNCEEPGSAFAIFSVKSLENRFV